MFDVEAVFSRDQQEPAAVADELGGTFLAPLGPAFQMMVVGDQQVKFFELGMKAPCCPLDLEPCRRQNVEQVSFTVLRIARNQQSPRPLERNRVLEVNLTQLTGRNPCR